MVTIASRFSTTSQILDTSLIGKVEINNEKLNKVKINNLKATRELGIIMEEEFILGVRAILHL
jgi:hypothetical protein